MLANCSPVQLGNTVLLQNEGRRLFLFSYEKGLSGILSDYLEILEGIIYCNHVILLLYCETVNGDASARHGYEYTCSV